MLVHKPPEGIPPREAVLITRGSAIIVGRNTTDPSSAYVNIYSLLEPKSISRRHAVLGSDEEARDIVLAVARPSAAQHTARSTASARGLCSFAGSMHNLSAEFEHLHKWRAGGQRRFIG